MRLLGVKIPLLILSQPVARLKKGDSLQDARGRDIRTAYARMGAQHRA